MAHSPLSDENDEIDLTNRALVSLFIQYPDMDDPPDGDLDDDCPTASSNFGSEDDDIESSMLSNTTTRTTPLRNDLVLSPADHPPPLAEYPAFVEKLNGSGLPQRAVAYFSVLANKMLQIGDLLFPPIGNVNVSTESLHEICTTCRYLISLLESSCQRVTDQIDNVAFILTLAPFTVQATPEDLWANYKQMTELIIEHTYLPSRHEKELLTCLVHVYDCHVYHRALKLFRTVDYDQRVQAALDDLYDILMTIEETYRRWWKDVKELGDLYTKPTMRRILNSPAVMQQILENEGMKEAAETAASDPDGLGIQPVTRQILETLHANTRREQVRRAAQKC